MPMPDIAYLENDWFPL